MIRNTTGRPLLFAMLAGTALVAAAPEHAAAQNQGSVSADSAMIEEIVVTARKKEESLLDAPLAVSVFGQEELEDAGYTNIIEIAKATPGLFIEKNNQSFARIQATPRFRGVFFTSGGRLQQTATVFLDGIYMSGNVQNLSPNELQRVEIIKGPQSALFGRNTFAGAINYVTKDPGNETRYDLDLLGASRDEYRINASVEGAMVDDVLLGRFGFNWESNEGHYDNSAVEGQRLGDEEQFSVSGTLLFKPTDKLRVKLRGSYREVDDGPPAAQATAGINSHNFGGFLLENNIGNQADSVVPAPRDGTRTESVFRGTVRDPVESPGLSSGRANVEQFVTGLQADGRFSDDIALLEYNVFNVNSFGLNMDETRITMDARYDISDDITFSFLAGYNDEAFGYWLDFDLTSDNSFMSFSSREVEDYSFEARLAGSAMEERLFWTIGGSYVDVDIKSVNGTASFFGPSIFFGDIFRTEPFSIGAKTTGVFAMVDYAFNDMFSVTLEGRYQEDEIIDDDINASLPAPISPDTLKNWLPRATLRFQPNNSTTLYATYSEGNLPGGFNSQVGTLDAVQLAELQALAPGAGTTFDEETLTNYELGWKQSFMDGAAAINVAAFYMERTDEIFRAIELVTDTSPTAPNPLRTVAYSQNGASTDIYGVEIEGSWVVNENLSLAGSFAYIDAEIASFPDGAGSGDFGDIFGTGVSVEGQEAPRFPPLAASLNVTWEAPTNGLEMFDSWYIRGDVFYTDKFFSSNANVAAIQDAVDSNLRLGLRSQKYGVELFVTNLFDEDAPQAGNNFADVSFDTRTRPGGFFDFSREGVQVALRDKRQVGLRLNMSF